MIAVLYFTGVLWTVVLVVAAVALLAVTFVVRVRVGVSERGYWRGWRDAHDPIGDER